MLTVLEADFYPEDETLLCLWSAYLSLLQKLRLLTMCVFPKERESVTFQV